MISVAYSDFSSVPVDVYQGNDPKEINIVDINNDGTKDIVFVDNGKIQILESKNGSQSAYSALISEGPTGPQHFKVPSTYILEDTFTLSLWFKYVTPASTNGEMVIFGNGTADNYGISYNPDSGILYGVVFTTDKFKVFKFTNGPGELQDGQWFHLVFSYDSSNGTATGYLNGLQKVTGQIVSASYLLQKNTVDIGIGASASGVGAPFNGCIDEVSYFDKVLSMSEIYELYNFGTPNDLSQHSAAVNLQGWWTMGDDPADNFNSQFGSSPVLTDKSSNSADGEGVNTLPTNKVTDVPGN